ncbi:MAG TPA: hypothetical protein VH854_12045, partial [Thermoanaerobaculia bacterium]|nr:hypothetical protein [Thermoanaerobaculia bacterium]
MTPERAPRERLGIAAALLAAAVLAVVYFGRFAPAREVVFRTARPAAAAALVLLASLAAGAAAMRLARRAFARGAGLRDDGAAVDVCDATLLGVPLYGTVLAALAWGLPALPAATLATLVLAAAGLLVLRRSWRRPIVDATALETAVLGVPIALALIEAHMPVSSPDELVYKLAVPRAYLLEGRMLELPLNSESYFPGGLSLPAMGALGLSGGTAARLVFFAVFLLALRVVRRLGERVEPGAGVFAAAVVAWTPALMLIAGWCWADWGMIGLLLLSYEAWDRFRERPSADLAATCALALGAGLASKYSAAPWLVVFAAAVLPSLARLGVPRARTAACAAAVVILAGGFFYVRNTVWTGSPVAPFLTRAGLKMAHFREEAGLSGWQELIRGYDVLHPGIVDDALGVALPLCVLASPFALRGRRRYADLFVIGAAQLAAFVAFSPTSRLMLTALVPLGLLGAAALVSAWRGAGLALRGVASAGAALVLAGQLALVGWILVVSYDAFPYLVGGETEAQYVLRTRAYARPYAALAEKVPPDSAGRVLLLGENRSYHLDRPALSAGNLDGPRMAAWLARFPTPDALAAELRRLGVTHVLMHRPWYRVAGTGAPASGDMLEKEYVLEVPRQTDAVVEELLARASKI